MDSELERELFGSDSEDEGEEEPYVPPNGPPDSTWVHEALEVPEGLWVPNRWLPLYREVENSEAWLHSKYTKAFDVLRAADRPREAALKEANDANDAVRAAERALEAAKKKRDEANVAFTRLDAAHRAQQGRKNTAHDHWYNYLVAARDWTDSLTQPGARATKATERVEVVVDDEESVERRVPTPWEEEEEEEDLFGDNDTGDEGPSSSQRPPPPPAKRSRRKVVEPESSEEELDDGDVVMVGQRTWKQRDDEARRKAVDLTSPRATNSCVAEVFRKIGL